MHCSSCSTAVESALRALPGVLSADVALLSESATVRYSPASTSEAEVLEAVEACGFDAQVRSSSGGSSSGAGAAVLNGGLHTVKLRVDGMHCGACSSGQACGRVRYLTKWEARAAALGP
jgi:Cu+-exporting ATPase